MPERVERKKNSCNVSFDAVVWSQFKKMCVKDGISASFCFESLMRTFQTAMKAGDDLRAELQLMLGLYTQYKHDNFEMDHEAAKGIDRLGGV